MRWGKFRVTIRGFNFGTFDSLEAANTAAGSQWTDRATNPNDWRERMLARDAADTKRAAGARDAQEEEARNKREAGPGFGAKPASFALTLVTTTTDGNDKYDHKCVCCGATKTTAAPKPAASRWVAARASLLYLRDLRPNFVNEETRRLGRAAHSLHGRSHRSAIHHP